MQIHSATFVISNTDVSMCPKSALPEYAFIGRSNVGKSSLINMLCRRQGLAKTSSKPGKTLLINHFLINQEWHLVDLPGYGYAQTGQKQREKLRKMIERYCLLREQLVALFVLVDIRLEPQQIDIDFMQWLGENEIPFSIVFTKTDKLNKQKVKDNLEKYKQHLLETWEELPPIFITSSKDTTGGDEILNYIEQINKTL